MSEVSVVDTAWIRDRVAEGYADHKFGGYLFDRWLDQVKADAWDEAANTMRLYVRRNGLTEAYQLDTEDNPYRKQEEA